MTSGVGPSSSLREIATVFLRLGIVGFGGPAVHIAMMEDEVVRKRAWMTPQDFADMLGATNLIPGPNSTEMAMHCGHARGGWKGLLVAGACFIVPAVVITGVFAWSYATYGSHPQVAPLLIGIKPAVISVVCSTVVRLGRASITAVWHGVLAAAVLVALFLGAGELAVLFAAGACGMAIVWSRSPDRTLRDAMAGPLTLLVLPSMPWDLFWTFLKIGSVLYGSGYVLFALLDAELVQTGLLGRAQLVDAIAIGQATPGPVFSSATFVGWQIAGFWGALAATVGIFLPSFVFVALLVPLMTRLRNSPLAKAFLASVTIASIVVVLMVTVDMARTSVTSWSTAAIALLSLVVVVRYPQLNTAWIVAGGAVSGWLLTAVLPV